MSKKQINLSKIQEEALLDSRVCDLPLAVKGTWLEECIGNLYTELNNKSIKFKPQFYLADEWLTPDKEPVIGIPFFLAHPVLIKLERKMMLDVEGGTRSWCMKLLRHETGHAINYAYKLYRRKRWQQFFGQFSKEYKDTYRFRPYSKNFVRHLEDYYAQYHPDEDFAETFAVWLAPNLNWHDQYKGWKVLTKLNYVNDIINEINDKKPLVERGQKYWQASKMRVTLKNFYKKKRYSYAEDLPDFHDSNLKSIFISKPEIDKKNITSKNILQAADVIKRHNKDILNNVAKWTGERKYIINDLLSVMVKRCKDLRLVADEPESLAILKITTYITTLVMNYLYTGGFRKEI